MSLSRRITTAVAVLFVAAGTLAAQSADKVAVTGDPQVQAAPAPNPEPAPAPAPAATDEKPVSLAPFAQDASVGVRQHATDGPTPYAPPKRAHTSNSVALMIVGGAALIVGAVIGGTAGTLVMVGGGVIGLVGLYQYLQ